MAITPDTTIPIFTGSLIASGMIGPGVKQMASGLSLGLFQYLQSGVVSTSIDVGTLGVGAGVGAGIILLETILLPALTDSMTGHAIIGPMMPSLASGISIGISASLALAVVQTINPFVGIGLGKVQFLPNGSGGTIFSAAFTSAGMSGSHSSAIGSAVGLALDAVIVSSIGVVIIAGIPNIIPSAGVGRATIS